VAVTVLRGKDAKLQKEIKACFERSKKRLEKASTGWEFDRKLMIGKYGPNTSGISEAYGLFRSLVSNILVSSPEAYFEGKKPEQSEIAKFMGDATNYDMEIGKYQVALKRGLWRTFPYGIGYVAENVESKYDYKDNGQRDKIKSQSFNWINPPSKDVLVDADGFRHDLYDHRYVFMAYYKTVDELEGEKDQDGKPFYKNLGDLDKAPSSNEGMAKNADMRSEQVLGNGSSFQGPQQKNPKFNQLKLWKMYDRVGKDGDPMVYHIFDWNKKLVAEEDWPVPVEIQGRCQFPVRPLVQSEESEDFYPPSEVSLIRPQLVNKVRLNDEMIRVLTNKLDILVGLSPYVDDKKLGKMLKSGDRPRYMITSNNDVLQSESNLPKVDQASDALTRLQDPMLDPAILQAMNVIDLQIQNIMGYGFPSRGGLPAIRSAKEAARVSDSMQRSLLDRQTIIEKFTRDCAIYHVLLLKAVTPEDEKRYYRVTDKMSAVQTWLTYNPTEIPNESDIFCDVYVGSSTPQNLDAKRAQWTSNLQVMWPLLEKMGYSPAPLLFKWAEVNGVKNPDQFMKNQKGASQELLAALIRAGQMGNSPDSTKMLLKAVLSSVDSVLGPGEKQAVYQAMQKATAKDKGGLKGLQGAQQAAGALGAGEGGDGGSPEAPAGGQAMGNAPGGVQLGDG
jgi:hypothetical protein